MTMKGLVYWVPPTEALEPEGLNTYTYTPDPLSAHEYPV